MSDLKDYTIETLGMHEITDYIDFDDLEGPTLREIEFADYFET